MHKYTYIKNKQYLAALNDFNELLRVNGYKETEIKSPRRAAALVDKREHVACELRRFGYSYPVIAQVMGKDHSSIMNLIKRAKKDKIYC